MGYGGTKYDQGVLGGFTYNIIFKDMTQQEKKQYILQQFKTSSGARITEMLKRYYVSLKESTPEPLFVTAQKIFGLAKQG